MRMSQVEKEAIECVNIANGARNDVHLKSKDSLLQISRMTGQPILRHERTYMVLDGQATAYIYEEK
jgi:hypothetical protein